jgi:RNA polymerase sigma-70 factor (ECF subfamily)
MNEKTDKALLDEYLAGDDKALTQLVVRYQKDMYRFVFRVVGNHADTEDVCQKVFVNLFLKADQYYGGSSFKTWLYQIAINQCKNQFRSNDRQRTDNSGFDLNEFEETYYDPLEDCSAAERRQKLDDAVNKLPTRQRATVQLRLNLDCTFKEIAEIMKVSVGTAKAHHHQAVTSLKNILQEDEYETNKMQ